MSWWTWLWGHWAYLTFGLNNGAGSAYLFWSGAGSDISELALFAGLAGVMRKYNCEVHGCWRLGRHRTAAGHMVCRWHHPDDRLTAQDVVEAHADAIQRGGPGVLSRTQADNRKPPDAC